MDSEKMMELELLGQQLEQVQQYLKHLESQSGEVDAVLLAIEEYTSIKGGEPALVPLANGIFVKAALEKNLNFFVNIGDNTVVEKSLDETKKLLERQKEELEQYQVRLRTQFQELIERLSFLEQEADAAMGSKIIS